MGPECYRGGMATVKLSISLSEEDVAFIDRLAADAGFESRSAVIQHAIERVRATELQADYAEAWDDWRSSGDDEPWDASAGDGAAPAGASAQTSAKGR